jgi:hypothetical protein
MGRGDDCSGAGYVVEEVAVGCVTIDLHLHIGVGDGGVVTDDEHASSRRCGEGRQRGDLRLAQNRGAARLRFDGRRHACCGCPGDGDGDRRGRS